MQGEREHCPWFTPLNVGQQQPLLLICRRRNASLGGQLGDHANCAMKAGECSPCVLLPSVGLTELEQRNGSYFRAQKVARLVSLNEDRPKGFLSVLAGTTIGPHLATLAT